MKARSLPLVLLCLFSLAGCRQEQVSKSAPQAPPKRPSGCRYIDKTGAVVVDPSFVITDGFGFSEGVAGVKNDAGLLGFIDRKGALVVPFEFSDGTDFKEHLAGILKNGMCGYIDHRGSLIISLRYDTVNTFRQGWGSVQRSGAWTFVNARGEEMGQWFAGAESFSEDLAAVAPAPSEAGAGEPRYGYVDTTGKVVIPPGFEHAEPFSDGLAAVMTKGKWGYISRTGKLMIEPRFQAAGPFSEGLAQIRIDDKMGYIDASGKIVIEPRFELDTQQEDPDEKIEMTGKFVDGLACVRFALGPESNGGWGFIDRTGAFVIPPRFKDADMFSEGLAAVRQNGKWGFVDPEGRLAIPAKYDRVKRFSEGLALVEGGR